MKPLRVMLFICLLCSFTNPVAAKKQGKELIDSLQTHLGTAKEDTYKVSLLTDISYEYARIDPDKGLEIGNQSLALAKKIKSNRGEAWALNSMANCYLTKSDYAKGLDYFFKALKLHEERADTPAISIALANISSIYYIQKDYDKTLEVCFRALSLAEKVNDKTIQLNVLGNIGIAYHSKKEFQKAAETLEKAVAMAEGIERKDYLLKNLGNLANTYTAMGDYPRSLEANFKALGFARVLGLRSSIAIDLGNIGETYLHIAKDSNAIQVSKHIPAGKTANLGLAISYLQQGVQACKEIGFLAPMAEFNKQLSEAYRTSGNYKAALEAYESYITYSDSVYSAESQVKITNLETQREVELKNKQIEIDKLAVAKKRNERGFFIAGLILMSLIIVSIFRSYSTQKRLNSKLSIAKKKVEERTEELDNANKELNVTLVNLRDTQEQLIQTEKQKENEIIRRRISQDIHDDISSELTRISWISELAKTKTAKADFGDMPGLMEKITASSRETVAKLGEIIWAANPKNDTLESLCTYMHQHINRFFADTDFSCTVDLPQEGIQVLVNPELKRNLFLVMKEALNNTVKYSSAKHVHVSLQLTGNSYKMSIADDGKGIEEGVVKGGGNGLGNMRRRMEDVQGYCTIVSTPGKGTEICCHGNLY